MLYQNYVTSVGMPVSRALLRASFEMFTLRTLVFVYFRPAYSGVIRRPSALSS